MRHTPVLLVALAAFVACNVTRPQAPPVLRDAAVTRPPAARPGGEAMTFSATAYAIEGITKAGTRARRGIVAADPRVLPLGSRIRVSGAGSYSGEYLVEDTGPAVKGRIIDIKVGSTAEAIKFGRRKVQVEVLRRGYVDAEASAK